MRRKAKAAKAKSKRRRTMVRVRVDRDVAAFLTDVAVAAGEEISTVANVALCMCVVRLGRDLKGKPNDPAV